METDEKEGLGPLASRERKRRCSRYEIKEPYSRWHIRNCGGKCQQMAKSVAAATESRNLEAKAGKAEFPQVHVRTFVKDLDV